MNETQRSCPKCNGTMHPGLIIDLTHRDALGAETAFQREWVAISVDEIQTGKWIGGLTNIEGRERHKVLTYCCSGCRYLESFVSSES